MNFFKSVFAEEPTPPASPPKSPSQDPTTATAPTQDPTTATAPTQDPTTATAAAAAWSFGGLIKTLATKSESVIETYRRDLEDLGSGLRKETAVIRQVASRAVHDLPASLEAGASVAQESLEFVGQAIDDIGSTVWNSTAQIISHGRDSSLARHHDSDPSSNNNNPNKRQSLSLDVKRYSRFDMQVRALQCDLDTYCTEPDDKMEYEEWRLGCLVLEDKKEEIENLLAENGVIKQIYNDVVPGRVDNEVFWSRYLYRMHKLKQAEEARAMLVKRAIAGEEDEHLTWDFDDDDEQGKGSLPKEESSANIEIEKKKKKKNTDKLKEKIEDFSKRISEVDENDDKLDDNGRNSSESSKDSDMSVVSSQSLPEEDLGWDKIEDVGSNDESKGEAIGSTASTSASRVDLRKRWSAAGEEEVLSWDIEDEDDVPVKH